jgi:hypothetical protein
VHRPDRRQLVGGVVAAALLSTSCGPSSVGGLPTHRDLGGGPAALLTGTLILEGSCLYAVGSETTGRWLPVWPPNFGLAGDVVMDGTRPVARVGDVVKLGGGEYAGHSSDFLRTLMDGDVPAECQHGAYWLVTEVVP